MADVYVNALTTISTEPTTTDSIVAVNRNTNEGKIIDYNKLADVILNKIASKQFSGLNTTSKLLVGAINELDSDVSSLNSHDYFAAGTAIPANSDLNDYKTVGTYRIAGGAIATSTANIPRQQAGVLVVRYSSSTTYIFQEYYPYTNPEEFYRRRYTDSWSVWYKFSGTVS